MTENELVSDGGQRQRRKRTVCPCREKRSVQERGSEETSVRVPGKVRRGAPRSGFVERVHVPEGTQRSQPVDQSICIEGAQQYPSASYFAHHATRHQRGLCRYVAIREKECRQRHPQTIQVRLNKPGTAQVGAPLEVRKAKCLESARDTIVKIAKRTRNIKISKPKTF